MKNPNGFGTVVKLSGKRRRPYMAKITIGWDETGKQLRHTVGYFSTKQEALKALGSFEYNPTAVQFEKLKFKEIADKWFSEHNKNLSAETLKSYKSLYENYIKDLEPLVFSKIKLTHLQTHIDNLREKVSTGTLKRVKSIISMIYSWAIKNEIVTKNLAEFIEIGKHETKVERRIFTTEEIDILWKNQNIEMVDTILILLYTGMRVNELLNLKKSDIHLDKNGIITGSKTEAGKNRFIPINKKILPFILNRMNNKTEYFLITNRFKTYTYAGYRKIFVNTLYNLKIERHTIHDCRHTTATLLSNAGANPTAIKNILGHSDYKITEKIYTHKDESELLKAINMV